MDAVTRYRGRDISSEQVTSIRQALSDNPDMSRRALSIKVCETWNWRQPNGAACDVLCRGLLLQLHRAGHIELPPPRIHLSRPRRHEVVELVDVEPRPLQARLSELGPVEIHQVRRTPNAALVKSLIAQHHDLGYVHPVGEHLKYLMLAQGQPIACMSCSSAARHLGCRNRAAFG
jgi:hypothetical protein